MKYLLIITLLIFSAGCEESDKEETEYKQVYYDCYYVSQEKFKKIPRLEYQELKLEDMCNENTPFLKDSKDEVCLKACRDAFNHYK